MDLLHQTLLPYLLIIVDGDPISGEVKQMFADIKLDLPIAYIPSNHANLPYQRYLGWRAARDTGADVLIYFDDDLRINQPDVMEWLTIPLVSAGDVVGVGCASRVPQNEYDAAGALFVMKQKHWLVDRFGSASTSSLKPGQLTKTGHRINLIDSGENYLETEWLQGRVMAYRMSAISPETFSDDLFAAYECRVGRGEDTFLSRRIGARGTLLYTFRAVAEHPNADTPKAYAYESFKFAYAATYSRRFLNDHYRLCGSPTLLDRWALVKSYTGNVLFAWLSTLKKPSKLNFARARGTTFGAINGLIRPPTTKRLTPNTNWREDAEKALTKVILVRNGSVDEASSDE